MNLKEIKEMIALMNENDLSELELERDGLKIRLCKGGVSNGTTPNIVIERTNAQEQDLAYSSQLQQNQQAIKPTHELGKNIVEIKAPMVGTFYRSPSPDAAPFVDAGSKVEIGQVVCIIEAMKLMNEIKSEVSGTVKEILIENADPIEFGQVLFIIETT